MLDGGVFVGIFIIATSTLPYFEIAAAHALKSVEDMSVAKQLDEGDRERNEIEKD